MFQIRPTPVSHGAVAQIQSGVTFLSLVALGRELACPLLVSAPASREATWASRAAGAQEGVQACIWRGNVLGCPGFHRRGGFHSPRLLWGQVTQRHLCALYLIDNESYAPPDYDYRNKCLMLLLWVILKSSLSVSSDYFWSLAIHISPKNLFAEWLKETGS